MPDASARADNTDDTACREPQEPDLTWSEEVRLAEAGLAHHVRWSLAPALIPVPLVDSAALAALQLKMLREFALLFRVPFERERGRSALAALLGGVVAAAPTAVGLLKTVPVAGTALGYAALLPLNAAATYAVGKLYIQHFASGGTFLTFDAAAVRVHFLALVARQNRRNADCGR